MNPLLRMAGKLVLAAAFALAGGPLRAEDPAQGATQDPTVVAGIAGTWTVVGKSPDQARTFEFLADGTVFDTQAGSSAGGSSGGRTKKTWKAAEGRIVIPDPAGGCTSIEIPIPYNRARMEINEITVFPDSKQTTTMYAVQTAKAPAPGAPAPAQVPAAAPPAAGTKLTLAVVPSSKKSNEGYATVEKLSLAITLKNTDLKSPSGLLKVSYWILGKGLSDSKQFCLLNKGAFDCALGTDFARREVKQVTEQYVNKYYYYSSYSYEYAGWIVRVSDEGGRTILQKASKTEWERQGAKADSLERGNVYSLQLDKLQGLNVYYD